MILPIGWLKELVDVKESSEELAEIFLALGFPADAINEKNLDLEITPNRGDCLSVLGLAREYAAFRGLKLNKDFPELKPTSRESSIVSIDARARKDIWRYSYFIAQGVPAGVSDPTTKERLQLIGLNSKNTIIDLTNYLIHETGQPLHAFDLDKIKGIRIDYAHRGDSIKLLNDKTVKLTEHNIIAYDGDRPIDLFGICGGEIPAVDGNTKKILVQAAAIVPGAIRRSSKSSGVITPASYRYERYVDYNLTLRALGEASRRLQAAGWQIGEVVDITHELPAPKTLELTPYDYRRITGLEADDSNIAGKLTALGFSPAEKSTFAVPSWRAQDVKTTEALAEEVLRLNGFNEIKEMPLPHQNKVSSLKEYKLGARASLAENGFAEHYSYSFISDREAKAAGYNIDDLVEVANPLSSNYQYLRPSLLVGLIKAALANPWINDIKLFEIGNVFSKNGEVEKLGMISTRTEDIWLGEVEKITPGGDLGRFFRVKRILYFSEVDVNSHLGSADPAQYINNAIYQTISKFPPVVSDIAFIINDAINEEEIIVSVKTNNPHILIAEIFDVYRSDKIGAGKKSIAMRLIYQDTEKTLTAEGAEEYRRQTIKLIKNNYHAQVRGE